jgi:hypothetical protein
MARHSFITYKGKEILYLDYRGLKLEQIIQSIDEAVEESLKSNRPICMLINITGVYAVPEFMEKSKEAGKKTKNIVKKQAMVGINSTAKEILLNAYNYFTGSNTKAFDDEESAKEWLVKD